MDFFFEKKCVECGFTFEFEIKYKVAHLNNREENLFDFRHGSFRNNLIKLLFS